MNIIAKLEKERNVLILLMKLLYQRISIAAKPFEDLVNNGPLQHIGTTISQLHIERLCNSFRSSRNLFKVFFAFFIQIETIDSNSARNQLVKSLLPMQHSMEQ